MVDGPASTFSVVFSQEDVHRLAKEIVEGVLGSNSYQHNNVNQWTQSIVEGTLAQLTKLNKPYKYIVTCVVMQKNGAGLHLANSCFWDNSTDGSWMVRWENKSMYCVVSVFACSI